MFALNCETFTWKRFFFLEGPSHRIHGAFANSLNYKYLIAGITQPENMVVNDLWQLSLGMIILSIIFYC